MATTGEIIAYLDDLLEIDRFKDYGPNGLQVPGREQVDHVFTGVSGTLDLFELAVAGDAAMVICHHGIFWDFHQRALTPQAAARLRTLLANDVNLAAYHLPLDAHAEVGNNALLLRRLGFEPMLPFGEHRGSKIGWIGHSGQGVQSDKLFAAVAAVCGRRPLVFDSGPDRVHSMAVVTGAAASHTGAAIASGVDAFLTGEPAEHVMAEAREGDIHFIAAGHYATEVFGVCAIGALVAERFGIKHSFVDLPNPV